MDVVPRTEGEPDSSAPPPLPPVTEAIRFHGTAREYFRIWIVNTLLTLLTAGVFLAWAKVRRRRYLRGSTELMGHRFDYRAPPGRLLLGNAVILLFFLGYAVVGEVYPPVRGLTLLVGLASLPWIVVRSLGFNAHVTVYRGLRFRFHRSTAPALQTFILEPLFILLTLGLYYPAWVRSRRCYVISSHRLGDAYFACTARRRDFYAAYGIGLAIVVGSVVVASAAAGLQVAVSAQRAPDPRMTYVIAGISLLGWFVAREFVYAWLFNRVWNATTLDQHRFVASLSVGRWLGISLGNLAAVILSAGLLHPWAVIRRLRYAASCLQFVPAGPVEGIETLGSGTRGSGVGESAAEFLGLDFGL